MEKQNEHPAVTFFKSLFQHCSNGFINLHFLPSGENAFVPLTEINSIPEILEKHKGESCCFGVATRKDGDCSRGGIVEIPALWIEIGSKVSSEKTKDFLEGSPLKPSFWIKFGNGYHIYFLLKKPVGSSEISVVESLNKRLAIYLKPFMANLDGCDAGRTFPVPGTPDLEKKKFIVYFYRIHPKNQYTVHDFDKNLPALPMASSVGTSPLPRQEKERNGVPVKVKPKSKPSIEIEWNDYLKRSKEWGIRVGFELIHSKAFIMLKYGPSIKLLSWMHEKIRVDKIQGKRGKQRFKVRDEGKFSFTYKEANLRGLSDIQFAKALRELHSHGFLEVHKPGSSLKGDFSVYSLSERWKQFGQPGFEEKEFPISAYRIKKGFRHGHIFYGRRKRGQG